MAAADTGAGWDHDRQRTRSTPTRRTGQRLRPAQRLGDDFEETLWAHGTSEPDDRYTAVDEEFMVNLHALTPDEREKLLRLIRRSIDASCTSTRSVHDSVQLTTTVDGDAV